MEYEFQQDTFDSALNCANNASVSADTILSLISKVNSCAGNVKFNESSNVLTSINKINSLSYNVGALPDKLKAIEEQALIALTGDSNLVKEALGAGYKFYKASTLGINVSGYIFVPEGVTSTTGLPMMVFIGGCGSTYESAINGTVMGSYLNNGNSLPVDMIIYCPSTYDPIGGFEGIQASVDTLANGLGVDKNRISAMGHSDGARAVLRLAAYNPNYYSTVVALAGPTYYDNSVGTNDELGIYKGQKLTDGLLGSDETKFIFITGTGDGNNTSMIKIFNDINEDDGNATLYYVQNGTHDELGFVSVSKELLTDMAYIEKGSDDIKTNNQRYDVNIEDLRNAYITKGDNAVNTYYHSSISKEEAVRRSTKSQTYSVDENSDLNTKISSIMNEKVDVKPISDNTTSTQTTDNNTTATPSTSTTPSTTNSQSNSTTSTTSTDYDPLIGTYSEFTRAKTTNSTRFGDYDTYEEYIAGMESKYNIEIDISNKNNPKIVTNTTTSTTITDTTTDTTKTDTSTKTDTNAKTKTYDYSGGSGSYYTGGSSSTTTETKNTYTLIIKYVYAHNPLVTVFTESKVVTEGTAYNYTPRAVSYYYANPTIITGVMPSSNYEVLVTYMPIIDTNGNGKADEEENLVNYNTNTETQKEVVNNYYYTSDNNKTENVADTLENVVEPTPEPIIEPMEVIDTKEVEITPEIHPGASAGFTYENKKESTNILPIVGAVAGVGAAAAIGKVLYDKSKEEKEDKEDEYVDDYESSSNDNSYSDVDTSNINSIDDYYNEFDSGN